VSAVTVDDGLREALERLDAAQLELQQGRPETFKALWSHADDVTLSGGFGGDVQQGWDQVGARLDWVGAQFSHGTNTVERLVVGVHGDLAYLVRLEHLRFRVPGQAGQTRRDHRVTMLLHRHADSQTTREPPR
jgi:ketosteroid isomerase-like protein